MSSTPSDPFEYFQTLGYDRAHLLTGRIGPPEAQVHFAVTVTPASRVVRLPEAQRTAHCKVLVSIEDERPSSHHIRRLLAEAPRDCVFVDWAVAEQWVFWEDDDGTLQAGSLDALPRPANGNGNGGGRARALTLRTLRDDVSLGAVFDRVEDVLHSHGIAKQDRYEVILHLLLAKLFDERAHASRPDEPLGLQPWPDHEAAPRFSALLEQVASVYGDALHSRISMSLGISGPTLAQALAVLAPARIGGASKSALQDFFMRFARDLYKWEMAQYFTPRPLTEFVVETVSPTAEEWVTDPAAGSGDFLMAAWERDYGEPHRKPWLAGVDVSPTAVRVAELNKILHNTHRCRFSVDDSLARVAGVVADGYEQYWCGSHVVVCNPRSGGASACRTGGCWSASTSAGYGCPTTTASSSPSASRCAARRRACCSPRRACGWRCRVTGGWRSSCPTATSGTGARSTWCSGSGCCATPTW